MDHQRSAAVTPARVPQRQSSGAHLLPGDPREARVLCVLLGAWAVLNVGQFDLEEIPALDVALRQAPTGNGDRALVEVGAVGVPGVPREANGLDVRWRINEVCFSGVLRGYIS